MFKEYSNQDKKIIRQVGLRIKYLRNQKGLSQDRLAIEAEIPKNQIGRIERSEINTSLVTLNRIAKALNVKIQDLFEAVNN
ncbi:MAG: helix-turn-helix transcriptional regulator [Maribacter sp.]|uniref:helix-turn-helix domain-containing protein n=1 Tax=Maribacter sp. TaxID=1897614 RepID=UPI003296BD28